MNRIKPKWWCVMLDIRSWKTVWLPSCPCLHHLLWGSRVSWRSSRSHGKDLLPTAMPVHHLGNVSAAPARPSDDSGPGWCLFQKVLHFWLHHLAGGILVPWPGIEPAHLQCKCGVLTVGPPGKSPSLAEVFMATSWEIWIQNHQRSFSQIPDHKT